MKISNYEVEVLVKGKPVQEYMHQGSTYIEAKEGTEFSLRLKNQGSKRALFIPTVDGLSVMDGKEASFDSRGYIVDPWESITVDGWRTSDSDVAKFFFSRLKDSYAASKDKAGNIGVIGCAVFAEKERPQIITIVETIHHHHNHPYPYFFGQGGAVYSLSAGVTGPNTLMNTNTAGMVSNNVASPMVNCASSLGTGFGEQKFSPVRAVEFERGAGPELITMRYNTKENLKAIGVEFKKVVYVSPSPFPKETKYCEPPRTGIYYGPHPCDKCGKMIARLSTEEGGDKFNYPEGPIYPNTRWIAHECKKDHDIVKTENCYVCKKCGKAGGDAEEIVMKDCE